MEARARRRRLRAEATEIKCPCPLARARCWARRASSVAERCRRRGRAARARSTLAPCNAGPWRASAGVHRIRGCCARRGARRRNLFDDDRIIGPLRYLLSVPSRCLVIRFTLGPPPNYYTSRPDLLLTRPYISMKGNTVRIPLPLHVAATYHTWPRPFICLLRRLHRSFLSPLLRAHLEGGPFLLYSLSL